MKYVETNVNPSGRVTGDCVVRALVKATGMTWGDTLRALTETACQLYLMPNDLKCYTAYLKTCGYPAQKCPRDANGSKMSIRQAFGTRHGVYLVQVSGHLTCVMDGVLYDTWDCQDKRVNRYWCISAD